MSIGDIVGYLVMGFIACGVIDAFTDGIFKGLKSNKLTEDQERDALDKAVDEIHQQALYSLIGRGLMNKMQCDRKMHQYRQERFEKRVRESYKQ